MVIVAIFSGNKFRRKKKIVKCGKFLTGYFGIASKVTITDKVIHDKVK
jgi:hypothetical protein